MPPLRERRDDILPLARVLLADAALRMKRKITGLAPDAADQLLRYDWPGNVRELENTMERAVALARGSRWSSRTCPRRSARRFPSRWPRRGRCGRWRRSRRSTSSRRWTLNDGNQTHTAEQLQIGSATLYRKLKSYGMTRTCPGPLRRQASH